MPITVVIRSSTESSPPSLTFDGDRVVLGRSDGCDVRLPDASVSHRHATLRSTAGDYVLIDEGSTNGTYIGGVRLEPHTPRVIRTGDLVRIGRVWVEVRLGELPATPDLGLATRDLALALVSNALAALGDDTTPALRIVEGPDLGAVLRLEDSGRRYTVGRGEACDSPLADEDASREHAVVVRRGSTVLVRDAGSRNGVLLGETLIAPDRDMIWRSPTVIRIGANVIALDEPVARALAELESGPDEELVGTPGSAPPPMSKPAAAAEEAPPASAIGSARGHAPIAETPRRRSTPPVPRKRAWTALDVFVVLVAVAVLAMSGAGFVWLLRG